MTKEQLEKQYRLFKENIKLAKKLRSEKLTVKKIAEKMNCTIRTVYRYLKTMD